MFRWNKSGKKCCVEIFMKKKEKKAKMGWRNHQWAGGTAQQRLGPRPHARQALLGKLGLHPRARQAPIAGHSVFCYVRDPTRARDSYHLRSFLFLFLAKEGNCLSGPFDVKLSWAYLQADLEQSTRFKKKRARG